MCSILIPLENMFNPKKESIVMFFRRYFEYWKKVKNISRYLCNELVQKVSIESEKSKSLKIRSEKIHHKKN